MRTDFGQDLTLQIVRAIRWLLTREQIAANSGGGVRELARAPHRGDEIREAVCMKNVLRRKLRRGVGTTLRSA